MLLIAICIFYNKKSLNCAFACRDSWVGGEDALDAIPIAERLARTKRKESGR